ncbi:hypothetical protein BGW37DRAFT_474505 [Umbelopsis sp. PMI_123]|nr:hypothetical protein BGW37DRAFT_474505 [Umbelopsis sp. PMI_123]
MRVLSVSEVTFVYQVTQYILNIAIAMFVSYLAYVFQCFDATVWFSSSQLSKIRNYKSYNMEQSIFIAIIILNVLTMGINFLPTILGRVWDKHWGYFDPVSQNISLESNQKAPSYLWGSTSPTNGPVFPGDGPQMIKFFCNQTTGCGKGAGLSNFTLALTNNRSYEYVTINDSDLTFPLSNKSRIRMDSTSPYGEFIILRDIPCPGNHTKYMINDTIMMSSNFTGVGNGLYCIPGDDSGFSLVMEGINNQDVPLSTLPASGAAVLSRNRLATKNGLLTLGSSIDLVTDEEATTYLATTSGISINIRILNANMPTALAEIGGLVNEAGFNNTNEAIIQSFTSEDDNNAYTFQAIKKYKGTFTIQHAFLYRDGSDTVVFINYRTISIARILEKGNIDPLQIYAVHIYLRSRASFNNPSGPCWKTDGNMYICGDSFSDYLGPTGMFAPLVDHASELIALLESRANATVYPMPVSSEEYYEGLQITAGWVATITVINLISLLLIGTVFLIKIPSYRDDLRQVLTASIMIDRLSQKSSEDVSYRLDVKEEKGERGTALVVNGQKVIANDEVSFNDDPQSSEQGKQLLEKVYHSNLEEEADEEKIALSLN